MRQEIVMRGNLFKNVQNCCSQVVYLKDLMNVYNHIQREEEKLKKAEMYVLITESALYDTYMVGVSKLVDKSKQAKTIMSLIDSLLSNKPLFKDCQLFDENKLNEYKNKLKQDEIYSKIIEIIRIRRDGYLVHNDNKYFGTKIKNDKTKLSLGEVWMLVQYIDDILNYMLTLFSAQNKYNPKYNNDLENLFTSGE